MGRPLDPKRDHIISLAKAAEDTRRYRDGRPRKAGDSVAFNAEPVLKMLHQDGCVGMRIYKGKDDKGEETFILVGVDKDGNDMTKGMVLDLNFPCPPYCGDDDELNT